MCKSGSNFVPISEAAQLLDTTEILVLLMLEKNELKGKMVDYIWQVDRSSITLRDKLETGEVVSPQGCGICGSGCGSGC